MDNVKKIEHKGISPCDQVEAFKIACSVTEALVMECQYLESIGKTISPLSQKALVDAIRAGFISEV